MSQMSVRNKLIVQSIICAVALALLVLSGIWSMRGLASDTQRAVATIETMSAAALNVKQAGIYFKTQVQEWKNILIRGNDPAAFDKYRAAFEKQEKQVQSKLDLAKAALGLQSDLVAQVDSLKANHLALGEKYREALKQFDKSDTEAGKVVDQLVKGMDRPTDKSLDKLVEAIDLALDETIAKSKATNEANAKSARVRFFSIALLGMLGLSYLSFKVMQQVVARLGAEPEYAGEIVDRIAKGELDTPILLRLGDTTSLLARMQHMQQGLRTLIGQIQQSADDVLRDSTQIEAVSRRVVQGSNQQSDSAASMAAAVEEMTVSISHVSSSAQSANELAQVSRGLSANGRHVVQEAIAEINKIAHSFHSSSELIQTLGTRSDEVSAIVNVIKEIADQTNLLALNAAIEAARAGEQGRGFAVVADEVRKLAERTTMSTQKIAETICAIQECTQQAIRSMEQGRSQVTQGVNMAAKAGESIASIEQGSTQVLASISEISLSLREQTVASTQIAQSVERISHMADENRSVVGDGAVSAESLQRLATVLKSSVQRFKI